MTKFLFSWPCQLCFRLCDFALFTMASTSRVSDETIANALYDSDISSNSSSQCSNNEKDIDIKDDIVLVSDDGKTCTRQPGLHPGICFEKYYTLKKYI